MTSWLHSVAVAVLTATVGLLGVGMLASACVKWYRISSFEGGSGYFVVGLALFGAVVGFLLGLIVSRVLAQGGELPFLKALGVSWGAALVLLGVAAGCSRALADIPPRIDGAECMLEVELRLPVGVPKPSTNDTRESWLQLDSVAFGRQRAFRRGAWQPAEARQEGERWILPGSVPVFTQRGRRALGIRLNGEDQQGFLVPLPARPGKSDQSWSAWLPDPPSPNDPWPETKASYRFRVQPIAPPPTGPTAGELAAKAAAEEQARFDAIPADAPIADWLGYPQLDANPDRLRVVVRNLTARPDFVAELGACMRSGDIDVATQALRLVKHIPDPPRELSLAVQAAAEPIVSLLREVHATAPEADPSYEKPALVSRRFSAWLDAVRALRSRGEVAFTSELAEILTLARVRPDSHALRMDVVRVASYYLHEWAGVAPLPGDPPPR